MITARYTNVDIAKPSSVSRFENRTEVHTSERQNLGKMAPGTARALKAGEDKIQATNDDRVTFSNGGSIEDTPGEGGLLLTTPEGEQIKLENGWIDANWESNRIEVNFHVNNPNTGDSELWTQAINADGSVSLVTGDDADYAGWDDFQCEIKSDGRGTASASNYYAGDLQLSTYLQDGAVVIASPKIEGMAIAPAVPMEWLINA